MNYRIIEIIIIVLMLFSANCGMAQNSNYVSWFLEGGRSSIERQIAKYSLIEQLKGHQHFGYWEGRLWLVVAKEETSYTIFQGKFDSDSISISKKALDDPESGRDLEYFFSIDENTFLDYEIDSSYHLSFFYYVLYDKTHSIVAECSNIMIKKRENKDDGIVYLIPNHLLWKITMPEIFVKKKISVQDVIKKVFRLKHPKASPAVANHERQY